MRLITHNMLTSNVKGVEDGYPLTIEVTTLETQEADFDATFVSNMLPKLDYEVLRSAAAAIGAGDLPPLPADDARDDAFLREVHHALLEVHIVEGALLCPKTGRRFPITNGIPNMLLHEDEIL
ncbi:hypothetical protein M885DRAFT_534970 [Pelagophyceae sp. CCMP2097]|nr:hypothetical protein M885DRAFT_534970 [Pelagophyceae sp. CCMP2097]